MDQHKHHFHVSGLSCINCAQRTEQALGELPGVGFASVNLATGATFVAADRPIAFAELQAKVAEAGYAADRRFDPQLEERRYRAARFDVLLAWAVTLPLSLGMLLGMLGSPGHHQAAAGTWHASFPWLELLAGLVLLAGAGRGTLRGAWIAVTHRHANMDTLVSLGALASLSTALLHVLGRGPASLDLLPWSIPSYGTIAAMILALHLTGRYLESRLRDRAAKEVRALLALQAREARLVLPDRGELLVPLEALTPGQLVRVGVGERLPVDGEVVEGRSAVDESLLTGESVPVTRGTGDPVTGGALNLTGPLLVRVGRVGEESFLGEMIRLIQEVQGGKVPIQALADRVTAVFVPTIVLLALGSSLAWLFFHDTLAPLLAFATNWLPWAPPADDPLSVALFAGVATLLIACPCALGLATPLALARGTGLLARRGLIVRNAEAIQTASEVSVLVLDKTGTLTQGAPRVVTAEIDDADLRAALLLEARSSHPLARAVVAHAQERLPAGTPPLPAPEEVREVAGQGIQGRIGGVHYEVGRPDEGPGTGLRALPGQTRVVVRRAGQEVGTFILEDPLRAEAPAALTALSALGLHPVMATGDQEEAAWGVAARLGIAEVHAGVRPATKLSLVRSYQALGRRVLMVGDGINDAAALKGADIGVALGSGLDLAIDSADVVIVRGGVARLVDLLQISRRTFTAIRQNLFFAFLYNGVAIPLAMLGLLHPAVAEGAMVLSSITVILNGLRIRA
ncbi:MAG: cation-translocating P-type ATPase [Myxococcota bacterium]|jgi:Cu+-exporting ATPase|nr:cation-translocating P-type ATPase [Myxococcota bacterium]